jgi:hypothetical protein
MVRAHTNQPAARAPPNASRGATSSQSSAEGSQPPARRRGRSGGTAGGGEQGTRRRAGAGIRPGPPIGPHPQATPPHADAPASDDAPRGSSPDEPDDAPPPLDADAPDQQPDEPGPQASAPADGPGPPRSPGPSRGETDARHSCRHTGTTCTPSRHGSGRAAGKTPQEAAPRHSSSTAPCQITSLRLAGTRSVGPEGPAKGKRDAPTSRIGPGQRDSRTESRAGAAGGDPPAAARIPCLPRGGAGPQPFTSGPAPAHPMKPHHQHGKR